MVWHRKDECKEEITGKIIDIFEDFLEEKGVDIPNAEKDTENTAHIYGKDYDILSEKITSVIWNPEIITMLCGGPISPILEKKDK
mgnify:CR=1 FL=1